MIPMFETTASYSARGSPVSEASAVNQVMRPPTSLAAPMATSSGVRSTAVTVAPLAAAANAALPVPHARSTSAPPRSGTLRSAAATTSSAMLAMCSATDS